jgi:hypothetical protein
MSHIDPTSAIVCHFDPPDGQKPKETVPLGGLGVPLAEIGRIPFPALAIVGALRSMKRPPQRDLGLTFNDSPNDCSPILLGGGPYYDLLKELNEDVADKAEWMTGCDFWQILPIFNVPATTDYWADRADLLQVFHALDEDPSLYSRAHCRVRVAPYKPVAWRRPRVSGAVTRGHIQAFATDFPGFASQLEAAITWGAHHGEGEVSAEYANSVAASLLGFEVDLRVGSLVGADDTCLAVKIASGTLANQEEEDVQARIYTFLDALVPWVKAGPAFDMHPEMDSASWSCAIDAALHVPDIWVGPAANHGCGVECTEFADPDRCIAWYNGLIAEIRS